MAPPKHTFFRRVLSVAPNFLRLSAFLAVCYIGVTLLTAKTVEAEVREVMLGVGAELMALPGNDGGEVRQLTLNGAAIQMRTGFVPQPMTEVLDHYEQLCMRRDGRLAEQLSELTSGVLQGEEGETLDTSDTDATMRWEARGSGYVTCLDMGEEKVDHNGIVARLSRFIDSGDLSDVGQLRYMYVTEAGDEAAHVVTMWSDSSMNLYEMFPTDGTDAVGEDLSGIPRLPGSQRILSAQEDGRAYGVAIYFSDKSNDEVGSFYREAMMEVGFDPMETLEGEEVNVEGSRVLAMRNADNRLVAITATPSDNEDVARTIVTIVSSEEE